jgi:hypothetical protein
MGITTEVERASADQLRGAADILRTMATRHGLSDLRLDNDGTLFVHIVSDPGYRPLLAFLAEATRTLGVEPNVVSDDAPVAASRLQHAAAL